MEQEGRVRFDSVAIELKLVKNGRFDFKRLPDHQIEALKQTKKGFYYKIQDMAAINGFANPKPFDCFQIKGEAYVAICFYVPYKRKTTYFITIENYLVMKENTDRKSATEDMCSIASNFSVNL